MSTTTVGRFVCISKHTGSQKHFFAAEELYVAGVWIGYLAPDSQGESYRGLPSFSQLKSNCKNFNPPFPLQTQGVAGEERHAICRGCVGDESRLITLREITYLNGTKLVVMPIRGDYEQGLFCILIPQPNDRSLPMLQTYRPYELRGDGQGRTFSNSFMLLTLRNTSHVNGTLETIRAALRPPEELNDEHLNSSSNAFTDVSLDASVRNEIDIGESSTIGLGRTASAKRGPTGRSSDARARNEIDVGESSTAGMERVSSAKRDLSDVDGGEYPVVKRHRRVDVPVSRTQQPTPASRDDSPRSSEATVYAVTPNARSQSRKESATVERGSSSEQRGSMAQPSGNQARLRGAQPPAMTLGLTPEQCRRVHFNWTIAVEGIEYEFSHALDECQSFSELLFLIREDTEMDPEVTAILEGTSLWRMTYQLPGNGAGIKKAFTIRGGNETAFDRLQTSLVQSSAWDDHPGLVVNVDLRRLK